MTARHLYKQIQLNKSSDKKLSTPLAKRISFALTLQGRKDNEQNSYYQHFTLEKKMKLFRSTREIAIDIDEVNTVIVFNGEVVVDEPSVVLMLNGKYATAGKWAVCGIIENAINPIRIRPLGNNSISDYEALEFMIWYHCCPLKKRYSSLK